MAPKDSHVLLPDPVITLPQMAKGRLTTDKGDYPGSCGWAYCNCKCPEKWKRETEEVSLRWTEVTAAACEGRGRGYKPRIARWPQKLERAREEIPPKASRKERSPVGTSD